MFATGKVQGGASECSAISGPVKDWTGGQNQTCGLGLREESAGQVDRMVDRRRTRGWFCGRPGRTAAFIVDQMDLFGVKVW